jgi:hypothetical protein
MVQSGIENAIRDLLLGLADGQQTTKAIAKDVTSLVSLERFRSRFQNPIYKIRKAADRKRVLEIAEHAEAIEELLQEAPLSALSALPDFNLVVQWADAIQHDAAIALKAIIGSNITGPRQQFAQEIEKQAGSIFERYTHQKATLRVNPATNKSYGPYLAFLKSLFAVMEIKASPAGVISTRKKKTSKSS